MQTCGKRRMSAAAASSSGPAVSPRRRRSEPGGCAPASLPDTTAGPQGCLADA